MFNCVTILFLFLAEVVDESLDIAGVYGVEEVERETNDQPEPTDKKNNEYHKPEEVLQRHQDIIEENQDLMEERNNVVEQQEHLEKEPEKLPEQEVINTGNVDENVRESREQQDEQQLEKSQEEH